MRHLSNSIDIESNSFDNFFTKKAREKRIQRKMAKKSVTTDTNNRDNQSTNDAGGEGEGDGEGEQTFLQKNGKYLIIGAVVLVVGYFAYKKYR